MENTDYTLNGKTNFSTNILFTEDKYIYVV